MNNFKILNKPTTIFIVILFMHLNLFAENKAETNIGSTQDTNISKSDINSDEHDNIIYYWELNDNIEPGSSRIAKKAIKEAEELDAKYILLEINTFGGSLQDADKIRTLLLECEIPTISYVNINAASAGALISIACDSIFMNPAASIGAASVVNEKGELMPDKYQSYMRAIMRSTAQANNRNSEIAEAMVDESIYVENISDSGKVLTFTAEEALEHDFCDKIFENKADIYKYLGEYKVVKQEINASDKIIHFLINPFVSSILIMLIVGGIYFELQAPGIGFALGVAIVASLLYFAPLYIEGLAANWEIIVFIIGICLLLVEIFIIPGFGIAGVLGILAICTSLALALINNWGFSFEFVEPTEILRAFLIVLLSIMAAIVLSYVLCMRLFGKKVFGVSLALDTEQRSDAGYISVDVETLSKYVGTKAITASILRPSGKIIIDNELFDATAEIGFIEKDIEVIIRRFENAQFFVRKT